MNAELLLQHFDRMSEAPDAIPRLRQFILDLAIRGKLVEQNPGDEPAEMLMKRVHMQKGRQFKSVRPTNPESSSVSIAAPFPLPKQWVFTRLGDVIQLTSGQHLQPGEYGEQATSGLPYITGPADFGPNGLVITRYALVRKAVAKKGQILLTVKGAGVGKTTTCDLPEVAISRQLMSLTAIDWNQQFLLLATHRLAASLKESARSLIPGISRPDVEEFVFPLPPLPEQHRIVEKVEELMALCDGLQAAQAERERRRDRLAAASLHRLNQPADPADPELFRAHARFYINHLPRLTTRPDQIKQLRQTILNLAVRGKLISQTAGDLHPVGIQYKTPVQITAPFAIPDSWRWTTLKCLGELRGGGTPSKARPDYWSGPIPWVSPKDMKRPYIFTSIDRISPDAIAKSTAKLIDSESILFVVRGMILAHSFPVAVSKVPVAINQDMKALTLHIPSMSEYVLQAMMGLKPLFLEKVLRSSHGTCRLESGAYESMPFPIPPIAEQSRIVDKIGELMTVCDQLEAARSERERWCEQFLESVLQKLLKAFAAGAQ